MRTRALLASLVLAAALLPTAAASATAPTAPLPASPRPDETRVIGRSHQGRPIVAERYGSGPVVILVGDSIHGNEKSGGRITDAIRAGGARPGYTLWVLPRMNPDGYRVGTRQNARGVDLNRNFDVRWSRIACPSKTCSGPRAASEPETVVFQNFFREIRPMYAVFYHSRNNGVDDARATAGAPRAVSSYAHHAGIPVRTFSCAGPCTGTATGYIHARVSGSTAFVVELPTYDNTLSAATVQKHFTAFWAGAGHVHNFVTRGVR